MKTKQVTVSDLIEAQNERDTYRELCGELVKQMKDLISEAEFITQTDMFFAHRKLITRAEQLLGENDAT